MAAMIPLLNNYYIPNLQLFDQCLVEMKYEIFSLISEL
jgi:hypothetical protein